MNLLKHIALVTVLAVAPALALAQAPAPSGGAPATTKPAPGKGKRAERFKAADKDGDGALSKAEADAAGLKGVSKNFDRIDTNKDGKVTRDEMRQGDSRDTSGAGNQVGPAGVP